MSRGEPEVFQKMSVFGPRGAQASRTGFSDDIPITNVPSVVGLIQLSLCVGTLLHTAVPTAYFLPSFLVSFRQIFPCGSVHCDTGDPTQRLGRCLWQWQLLLWLQALPLSPAAACKDFQRCLTNLPSL